MRAIRLSITFNNQLNHLLNQGEARFGELVVAKKKALVFRTIRDHLAHFPASRVRDEDLGLYIYPVTNTPFLLAYDFDDSELRIHYVLYKSADRTRVDPAAIEW